MPAPSSSPSQTPDGPPGDDGAPETPSSLVGLGLPLARRHGAERVKTPGSGPSSRRRNAKTLTKAWRHLLRWTGLAPVQLAHATTQQRIASLDKQSQIRLLLDYKDRAMDGRPLPAFEDTEFRSFSQNGEDGLLLYLFALIGFRSRCAVEICASDGIQCNSANLIVNHGFSALLVDGRERKLEEGRRFYEKCPEVTDNLPHLEHAWVTRDTIDALIVRAGFEGEVDLLSIDLDGVDYWIWSAIQAVRPRVVVAEYNRFFSADKSVTVAYRDDFSWPGTSQPGASLGALVKLAKQLGYRLVGCQRSQFNAFFVHNSEGQDWLPEIAPETCLGRALLPEAEQQALLSAGPWVEV